MFIASDISFFLPELKFCCSNIASCMSMMEITYTFSIPQAMADKKCSTSASTCHAGGANDVTDATTCCAGQG